MAAVIRGVSRIALRFIHRERNKRKEEQTEKEKIKAKRDATRMTKPRVIGKSRGRADSPLPAGQISDLFKPAPEYLGAHKENEWDCGGRRNAQGCFRGS